MSTPVYLVATIKPWNVMAFHKIIKHYPGQWHLIENKEELSVENIKALKPEYIFFPHWSHMVPVRILELAECICFHETDLPFGRGGSPIQNLISRGHRNTVVSAINMVPELDAGPILLKRYLSLEGLAEEIFIRASLVIADMIKTIVTQKPSAQNQAGEVVIFKRRKPEQSKITNDFENLSDLFDHIRMLDAQGYPKAYLEVGDFKFEFSRPALKTGEVIADAKISLKDGSDNA